MLFFPSFQNQFIRCLASAIAWKLKKNNCLLKSRLHPSGCMRSNCFCPDKRNSFEISREIWFGSYFCLFGRLHFEKCMLTIHGELIKYWHVNYRVWGSGSLGLWFKSYQTAALFPSGILLCTVFKIKRCEKQIRFDVKFFKMAWTIEKLKWNVSLLVFNCNASNRHFMVWKTFTRIKLQYFDSYH